MKFNFAFMGLLWALVIIGLIVKSPLTASTPHLNAVQRMDHPQAFLQSKQLMPE